MGERMNETADVNLLDHVHVLARHKRLIGAVAGCALLVSVIATLLIPNKYSSTASILPPSQDGSLQAAFTGRLAVEQLLGAGGTTTEIWIGILNSRSIWDEVITRLKLVEHFGLDTVDDARKALGSLVQIAQTREGLIAITAESTDAQLSAALANAFVEELDKLNRKLVVSSGRRMRLFVEGRLKETAERLAVAEEELMRFQQTNRAVKLDEQTKAIIESIGMVKGKLVAKEVELKTLLSYATQDHPKVTTLTAEVKNLRESLAELEDGGSDNPGNPHEKDIFIPTQRLPALGVEYVRLLREAKMQETLFELLSQQYELARAEEAKDSPTIQVLDTARPSSRKSGPKRKRIVFLSTFAGLFAGVSLAFVREYLEEAARRTEG